MSVDLSYLRLSQKRFLLWLVVLLVCLLEVLILKLCWWVTPHTLTAKHWSGSHVAVVWIGEVRHGCFAGIYHSPVKTGQAALDLWYYGHVEESPPSPVGPLPSQVPLLVVLSFWKLKFS